MVLRRIGVLSAARVVGILYGIIGLLIGVPFSLLAVLGAAVGTARNQGPEGVLFGLFFGLGAIVILPVFYGFLGFVFTALTAALYNVVAGLTGGIEVDLG